MLQIGTLDKHVPLLAVVCFVLVAYVLSRKYQALPLPPSLKPHPLLGHLLALPSANEHIVYKEIGDQMNSNCLAHGNAIHVLKPDLPGDIISFKVLGQVVIVLNSANAASELLVKRSAIYSDRTELPMLNDEALTGWGNNTVFLRHGERWKKQRRITQTALHPTFCKELWSNMENHTRLSVQRLLQNREDISSEFRWMAAATMLSCLYGYKASYPVDDWVELVETAVDKACQAASTSNFYVNIIPWLKYVPEWFPGASWKRKAHAWRAEKDKLINGPFEWTKTQMASETASPSMVKDLLDNLMANPPPRNEAKEEEDIIKWAAGGMYAAGAETTVASLMAFVQAMIMHPEVQEKVQAELDAVVGEDRLPELSDRDALPYLDCVLKESLRWHSPLPLGVPHVCSQDDVYKGYMVPKGAIVFGNVWAISNESAVYPEPRTFNPDRYQDESLPAAPIFGFGRRQVAIQPVEIPRLIQNFSICPGAHFAESSMFLALATLLSVFKLLPSPEKALSATDTVPNRLVVHPEPFACTVAPRSERRRRILEEWNGV
ncbi:cytochrome P450 family protein [Ceratobasidium sp. AG-Ba]|nr:cytochrome P450 family protein [Ceratobasidium sp. AG-Ba]